MDARDTGVSLGYAALAEAFFAACVIPGMWLVVLEIGILVSNPGAMAGAASEWKGVATQVEALKKEMEDLANGVPPDQWQAHDRSAFDDTRLKYNAELTKAHEYHAGVGDMLDIVSWAFYALVAAAFVISTIMAANAAVILGAGATIVGLLAVPALEAEANVLAGVCGTIISTMQGSVRLLLGGVMTALFLGEVTGTTKQLITPESPMFKQATLTLSPPNLPTLGTTPA
jgi:uncharacterized protein YeaO (DUF488 family)